MQIDDEHERQKAVKIIEDIRTGIKITGKIVNGKVIIDQSALDEIAKKFPNANKSFVAVNAPFDPKPIDIAA